MTEKESLSEFELVDSLQQVEYLKESMKLHAPTKVWTKGQQKRIDTSFGDIFESDQTFTVTGKSKSEVRAFKSELSTMPFLSISKPIA